MDDTGISIGSDQEVTRRKRVEHTVHSIDTGATRTITSKLASENSTQEEALRTRFSAMKVGTELEIEDSTGNKLMQHLHHLLLKQVLLVVVLQLPLQELQTKLKN